MGAEGWQELVLDVYEAEVHVLGEVHVCASADGVRGEAEVGGGGVDAFLILKVADSEEALLEPRMIRSALLGSRCNHRASTCFPKRRNVSNRVSSILSAFALRT